MQLQNLQAELIELLLNEEFVSESISKQDHINIYRNTIQSNLMNALIDIYPLVLRIVGDAFFRQCALHYINDYPSRSGNLNDFGEYFSHFLTHYPPVKSLVYLPEVATFEWMCHLLYFASDHEALDLAQLKNISSIHYEKIYFVLNPASFLKRFQYPILKIITLCKNETEKIVDLAQGGIDLLMFRPTFDLKFVPLSFPDYTFLKGLADNQCLADALYAAMQIDHNFDLIHKLPAWVKDKTIVSCYLIPSP